MKIVPFQSQLEVPGLEDSSSPRTEYPNIHRL